MSQLIVHALISNSRREILILKRSAKEKTLPGLWDIPGGSLHRHEDPLRGVIREIKEETGLTAASLELFAYTANVDRKKDEQFVRLIFAGRSVGGKIKLNQKDHSDYHWLKGSELKEYRLVGYLSKILNKHNFQIYA